jgi:hypothetical protein
MGSDGLWFICTLFLPVSVWRIIITGSCSSTTASSSSGGGGGGGGTV